MQTETLEKPTSQVSPYNEIAALIDAKVHAQTLEKINFLAREYDIRNPPHVAKFLSENVFLLDLLREIPAQIRKHFDIEQKLILEFFLNPEDPTWHQIHVLIPTKLSVDEAFERYEKFEADWWIENFSRGDMKILITREYVK